MRDRVSHILTEIARLEDVLRKVMNPHRRCAAFADFGDADACRARLHELRAGLALDDGGPVDRSPAS